MELDGMLDAPGSDFQCFFLLQTGAVGGTNFGRTGAQGNFLLKVFPLSLFFSP